MLDLIERAASVLQSLSLIQVPQIVVDVAMTSIGLGERPSCVIEDAANLAEIVPLAFVPQHLLLLLALVAQARGLLLGLLAEFLALLVKSGVQLPTLLLDGEVR